MAHGIRKACWLTLLGFLSVIVFGCGRATVAVPQEISLPETLAIDGQQWTKKEWAEAETKRVNAFFKKTPYLADNPGFSGQHVCYANDSGKERCYWVTATGADAHWLMIEFDGSKASQLEEGNGAPFVTNGN